jgi:hypothetical protein
MEKIRSQGTAAMTNNIIESVGNWGVQTSPVERRFVVVRPGDLVIFEGELMRYPVSHRVCRVDAVSYEGNRVCLVDGMGDAFLGPGGEVCISGGPFFGIPITQLKPRFETMKSRFWNWGDNQPGAGQGVEYTIERPVFEAMCHPSDCERLRK